MPQMTEPLPTSRPREPCLHHGLLTGVPFQSPALLAEALCDRTNRSVLPPELVLLLVMTSKESSPCSARTGKTHRAAPRQRSCRYTPKSKPAFILVSELREATCLGNHTLTHTPLLQSNAESSNSTAYECRCNTFHTSTTRRSGQKQGCKSKQEIKGHFR